LKLGYDGRMIGSPPDTFVVIVTKHDRPERRFDHWALFHRWLATERRMK
jgi:hypothetical protein